MSQPADAAARPDAPEGEQEKSEPLTFTLHVISPSVGVSSPLNFPGLAATTTVKQLKGKIRDALASQPADENQRLIHRGRMLGREGETMLEIFGQDTVGNILILRKCCLLLTCNPSSRTTNPKLYI